jgi:rifampicin phosphotransferase
MNESIVRFDEVEAADPRRVGGKAAALMRLAAAGFAVPPFFAGSCSPTDAVLADGERREQSIGQINAGLRWLLRKPGDGDAGCEARVAVRSSAVEEDGDAHSFAGQLDSFLDVPACEAARRIADVWHSSFSERARAYRAEHGLTDRPTVTAVIVQRMVRAEASGVAFAADPVTGRRGVAVVSAVRGLGDALVSGAVDADTYRIDRSGAIVERSPAAGDGKANPALTDAQVTQIAALARRASDHFGRPQDIEWAVADGRLYLLQSRPISSLSRVADPDGVACLWDNANIAESYNGITTPLTFSFARAAYEGVYRQFVKMMRVPARTVDEHTNVVGHMLGLVRGRVYYNLVNWYRLLAMLPGFRANRRFMEQMMGVREGLPAQLAEELDSATWSGRLRDRARLVGTAVSLLSHAVRLRHGITRFRRRVDESLRPGDVPLEAMRLDELAREYRRLEQRLLTRWDAPLVNDFLTMIFVGVLRKLAVKWCAAGGDADGQSLCNDLIGGDGTVLSAEPARLIAGMARLIAGDDAAVASLCEGDADVAQRAVAARPELDRPYQAYLARFADRCLEELKLESLTLADDPLPLLRSIGRTARRLSRGACVHADGGDHSDARRTEAQQHVAHALRGRPVRRAALQFVLRRARTHIREREALRFERTRVFGRVRRIFVQVGRRLFAEGRLADPRDVLYLDLDEVLGFVEGATTCTNLQGLAAVRKAEFARYHGLPAPAGRFQTRGAVHVGNRFVDESAAVDASSAAEQHTTTDDHDVVLRGTGCCPGVVRGRVEVVLDPRRARAEEGTILVAQRTDPGWVMLLPSAAGVLVERGSPLSHSAVLARELGVPAIVAIPGLLSRLRDGQRVEMDGATGVVRVLPESQPPITSDAPTTADQGGDADACLAASAASAG